jgi:glutathione S-transferase
MGQIEDASIIDLTFANIRAAGAVLDRHLAQRRFIVGDRLTLADIDIAAPFSRSARTKFPFEEFPHLMAWQQRLLDTIPPWAETKRELDGRMDAAIAAVGLKF